MKRMWLPTSSDDLLDLVVGEAQPAADGPRDFRAGLVVVVEPDALGEGLRLRLAHVVQEDRHRQFRRGIAHRIEHGAGVLEHVAFRMELRRLLDSGERFDLRQDRLEQAGIVHEPHGAAGVRAGEDADEFVADALGADLGGVRRHADHRRVGLLLDGVVEPRREPHRAQQAQLVLREPLLGIADRADHAAADVFLALDPVNHACARRIVEHPVDREVAPGTSSRAEQNRTLSGWRPSGEGASARNVATSKSPEPASTTTTPNCAPTVRLPGKSRTTSSGRALVAMS